MVHRSGPGGDGVLALRDPQQPKGFSGLEPTIVLHPGDRITTTCTFDTTSREVCSVLLAQPFLTKLPLVPEDGEHQLSSYFSFQAVCSQRRPCTHHE